MLCEEQFSTLAAALWSTVHVLLLSEVQYSCCGCSLKHSTAAAAALWSTVQLLLLSEAQLSTAAAAAHCVQIRAWATMHLFVLLLLLQLPQQSSTSDLILVTQRRNLWRKNVVTQPQPQNKLSQITNINSCPSFKLMNSRVKQQANNTNSLSCQLLSNTNSATASEQYQ